MIVLTIIITYVTIIAASVIVCYIKRWDIMDELGFG